MAKNVLRCVLLSVGLLLSVSCSVPDTFIGDLDLTLGDIDAALDAYTDSQRAPGSDMELLIEGPDAFEAIVDLIESAQDHIHIETLTFDDDTGQPEQPGLELATMLADKAAEGVSVKVIIDTLGQKLWSDLAIIDLLRAGGVEVRGYLAGRDERCLDKFVYRTHKKLLVSDGRRAVTGSRNLGIEHLGKNRWRDTSLVLTGPIVASVQREFIRDWQSLGGQIGQDDTRYFPPLEPTGELAIRAIDQRPAEDDFDINMAVLIAIRSAQETIDIEAPYLNPTSWVLDELTDAVDRGVEVRILLNSDQANDVFFDYFVTASWFGEWINRGIRIFLWDLPGRTMHSKAMAFDNRLAGVGSYNLNRRSIMWDAENMMFFTDPPAVEAIRQMIDDDINREWVFEVQADWLSQEVRGQEFFWIVGRYVSSAF